MTREYLSSIVLLILTGLAVVLCLIIAAPFIPALVWALAMAVVAHRLHASILKWARHPELAAGLAVIVVGSCLLAPVVFLGNRLIAEATDRFDEIKSGEFEAALYKNPKLSGALTWLQRNVNLKEQGQAITRDLQSRVAAWLQASGWAVIQLFIALFTLFFFFRDRDQFLRSLRRMLPLSDREADETLEQVRGMIHATVYGNATVAVIQGTLGGFMFWILGIPAALLWGAVMALMSLVPNLGAFVVWLPVAAYMAIQGEWFKAGVLAAWGALAVGSIDNILYPFLVGQEMRMHTIPVFIATVGGLAVFGAVGLILGPVAFACALALLDILRRRTVRSQPVEKPS
jgi:predicted PurR-regulated permease PerM